MTGQTHSCPCPLGSGLASGSLRVSAQPLPVSLPSPCRFHARTADFLTPSPRNDLPGTPSLCLSSHRELQADPIWFPGGGLAPKTLDSRGSPEITWCNPPILQMGKRRPTREGAAGSEPCRWGERCRGGRGSQWVPLPRSTSPSSPRATRHSCTTWRSSSALPSSRVSPTSAGLATPR